jgi:hypothetical protein
MSGQAKRSRVRAVVRRRRQVVLPVILASKGLDSLAAPADAEMWKRRCERYERHMADNVPPKYWPELFGHAEAHVGVDLSARSAGEDVEDSMNTLQKLNEHRARVRVEAEDVERKIVDLIRLLVIDLGRLGLDVLDEMAAPVETRGLAARHVMRFDCSDMFIRPGDTGTTAVEARSPAEAAEAWALLVIARGHGVPVQDEYTRVLVVDERGREYVIEIEAIPHPAEYAADLGELGLWRACGWWVRRSDDRCEPAKDAMT